VDFFEFLLVFRIFVVPFLQTSGDVRREFLTDWNCFSEIFLPELFSLKVGIKKCLNVLGWEFFRVLEGFFLS